MYPVEVVVVDVRADLAAVALFGLFLQLKALLDALPSYHPLHEAHLPHYYY